MLGESYDEPPHDTTFDETMRDLAKFFEGDEDTGAKINNQFTSILDPILHSKVSEEGMKKLMSRPDNIPNLTVPQTKSESYDGMRKEPLIVDGAVRSRRCLQLQLCRQFASSMIFETKRRKPDRYMHTRHQ